MKTIYVKDLVKGQIIDGETFAVHEVKQAQDKNGKTYYDLLLGDKTGNIKAKIWSDQIEFVDKEALKVGHIALIGARVDDFRGIPQLTIHKLEGVDESKLEEFLESSRFNPDEMWAEMMAHIESVQDQSVKQLLLNIVGEPELAHCLKYYPAGIYIHHGFRSGLIQHILEIISVCKSLQRFYPNVNFDLVIAGAILHDIGKVNEFKIEGVSTKFTLEGVFVGHLVMSYEIMLKHVPADMDARTLLKLKNILLGHNGAKEKGSPVLPVTVEAALHSAADDLVFKMGAFERLRKQFGGVSESEMSDYDQALGTRVYVGN
jgi:3'-5' exoribonuclease